MFSSTQLLFIHKMPAYAALLVGTMSLISCGGSSTNTSNGQTPPIDDETNSEQNYPVALKRSTSSNLVVTHGYSEKSANQKMVADMVAGVAVADYDKDGDLDLFFTRGDIGPNLLFANNGNGQFIDVTAQAGLPYYANSSTYNQNSGPVFADFNGDGYVDLFVGAINSEAVKLYKNNQNGQFIDVTASSGLLAITAEHTISAAAGDFDNDGDIDLVLSHWGSELNHISQSTEYLWQNISQNGEIKFADASVAANLTIDVLRNTNGAIGNNHDYSFSPSLVDINGDNHADLLMAADYGGSQIFINNTDGTFSNITDTDVITGSDDMGSALADFDNDGDLDWFVSAIYGRQKNGNHLYQNNNGVFTNVSRTAKIAQGGWGWAACAADFNGDTLLDIYQTNGSFTIDLFNDGHDADPSVLFINSPGLIFSEQAAEAGVQDFEQGRGVICADFNGDNKPDILLMTKNSENSANLYLNQSQHTNWLKVKLVGKGANSQALGATIKVTANGTTQTRVVNLASQYVSHAPSEQIFGLADNSLIEQLEVIWPDGSTSSQYNIQAGELVIQQP